MESASSAAPISPALDSKQYPTKSLAPSDQEKDPASNDLSESRTPSDPEKDSASAKRPDGHSLSQQLSRQLSHQLSRIATSDYPTGLRLAAIVVALVLSIFLVALDMVSSIHLIIYTALGRHLCILGFAVTLTTVYFRL